MFARRLEQAIRAGGGLVVAAVVLSAAASASPGANERADHAEREGGEFRVGIPATSIIDSIDPILASFPGALSVNQASCAGLMAYPDATFPAGLRLQPEIAVGFPRITDGGKTYSFTIRKGVRFSTGPVVTARSFAHTINRVLSKTMDSPYWSYLGDIVGARAVHEGTAAEVAGVSARRNTLTIRLTKASGDFVARVGTVCVLPESVPIDPEGVKAPVPSAAPYFISEYLPGALLVLDRNRYYTGTRPHHVNRIVVSIGGDAASVLDRVDRGELDYGLLLPGHYADRAQELRRRYGVDKSRFFASPALNLRIFVLNTSRPLFRNNVKLRQAVNFAVDRKAILRERGPLAGYLTDQYLPPFIPGFRDERIYPLQAPDLAKAQALAKGRTRGGKAVLYVSSSSPGSLAQGQVLAGNLAKIGLDVEIQAFPSPVLFEKMKTPGEPFDIGSVGWISVGSEWLTLLNWMFDGGTIANAPNFGNLSYFDSPKYNRLLEQASRLPLGAERDRAYAALDVDLAKNVAPAIPISYDRILTLVSQRTGCVVVNPYLDLAAVCLK